MVNSRHDYRGFSNGADRLKQVHFKRKPVRFVSPPTNLNDNVEVGGLSSFFQSYPDINRS